MEGMGLIAGTDIAALSGKSIFLTGHTGFKGSWMVALLHRLGCRIHGYALAPVGDFNLYTLSETASLLAGENIADIRGEETLALAMRRAEPDLVIHMAAQALVRRSYIEPVSNWATNVMGTVNVLEAARALPSVRGVLIVTTDKCYENVGWEWGYREVDRLGGHDPYSASKAAAELVTESYRRSFFADRDVAIVSARAGNVIGGGDWSEDRLMADAARAAASGEILSIRNPGATRPWQHVLDCLSGYLAVAGRMITTPAGLADAYNFGPDIADNLTVGDVLERLRNYWPELRWKAGEQADKLHEATYLYLDSARAHQQLQWRPRWRLDMALQQTAAWYRQVQHVPTDARAMMIAQIEEYLA